jgi:hypothetical protein
LEGLAVEDVGIFYGHFENYPAIWYFCVHLVHFVAIWYIFPRFGILYQEKSGNPGLVRLRYLFKEPDVIGVVVVGEVEDAGVVAGLVDMLQDPLNALESIFINHFHWYLIYVL